MFWQNLPFICLLYTQRGCLNLRNFQILEGFSKNTQIPNFWEIHAVGANLFDWAEGRTDGRTEDRKNDEIRYSLSQLFDRFSKSWLYTLLSYWILSSLQSKGRTSIPFYWMAICITVYPLKFEKIKNLKYLFGNYIFPCIVHRHTNFKPRKKKH